MDIRVIHGPTTEVAGRGSGLLYQVTLSNGAVATNPAHFGESREMPHVLGGLVFAEDGRLLAAGERG